MDELLVLKAEAGVREKQRAVFLVRAFSAFALVVPIVACSAFLARKAAEPLESPDQIANLYAVIWYNWVPLAILGLLMGACFAWLAWRAYNVYSREYRMTPDGVEKKELGGRRTIRWSAVSAELGGDLVLKGAGESWRIPAEWLGRDAAQAAEAYVKAKVPKEKITLSVSGFERTLDLALRSAPKIFAVLMLLILVTALYWVFLRGSPPTP